MQDKHEVKVGGMSHIEREARKDARTVKGLRHPQWADGLDDGDYEVYLTAFEDEIGKLTR